MNNNKAFTLIELLAVIIILSLLVTLSSVAITNIVKKSKNDLYDTQVKLIKNAAKDWYADNILTTTLPATITLENLKEYGFNGKVYNPKTGEEINNVSITISKNSNNIVEYEITIN